jgi:trigger factor
VEVKEHFEPKSYRGLGIVRKTTEVTDEMVATELGRLQESVARLVPVEGRFEAQEGDWAVIDHEGTIDGAPFEGSRAEGVTVRVAQGGIAEGNIPQLAGKKLGEVAELDEAMLADHRVESLRGKTAHMKVTLKALRTRELPPLDDDFAKEVGLEGVATLDALRMRMRADIEKREKRKSETEYRDALVKAALAVNSFEVPNSLVERALDSMIQGAAERFARSGVDIEQLQLDFARMRGELREQALQQVRGALLLEAIAEHEKVEVSEDELQKELVRLADELGAPLAKLQQQLRGTEARQALNNRVREKKVLALMATEAAPS